MYTPKLVSSSRKRTHDSTQRSTHRRQAINTSTSGLIGQSSLNLSVQSSMLDATVAQICPYGILPLTVSELIANAERDEDVSVAMGSSGWAWVVCGRKLLLWKYKSSLGKSCVELLLPTSNAGYAADTVTLLYGSDAVKSCVAVSPEGRIRYWPNINHTSNYGECGIELEMGESCARVLPIQDYRCVVGSCRGRLFVINCNAVKTAVSYRFAQNAAVGVMQGFSKRMSRRVSNLLFGSATSSAQNECLQAMAVGVESEDESQVYLLSGGILSKWLVRDDTDEFVYRQNVKTYLEDNFADEVWQNDRQQMSQFHVWPIDMQFTRDSVVILAAAVNNDVSSELVLGLASVLTEGSMAPQSVYKFIVLKDQEVYSEELASQVLHKHLLVLSEEGPSYGQCFVYDQHAIICASFEDDQFPMSLIEFQSSGDRLLGAGLAGEIPLFFSSNQGLVTTKPTNADVSSRDVPATLSMGETTMSVTLDETRVMEMSRSEDKVVRLKAAFLSFYQKKLTDSQRQVDSLCAELLPRGARAESRLDRVVVELSDDLIDDTPSHDPRWTQAKPSESSYTTTSLILINQLEEKLKALEYFVRFLQNTDVWAKLTYMLDKGSMISTHRLLLERAEKLVAAKALREIHVQETKLIDQTIERVLKKRKQTKPLGSLTPQDIFYREVSKIEDFLVELIQYEDEMVNKDIAPAEAIQLINSVNSILLCMLSAAIQHHKSEVAVYQPNISYKQLDFVQWTADSGVDRKVSTRTLLSQQHKIIITFGLELADGRYKAALLQQLVDLTDIILDGYSEQLEFLRLKEEQGGSAAQYAELKETYERERYLLLQAFVKQAQYERATSLAEKYCDYGNLVEICELTNNQERLKNYMDQLQNFADYVFQWYIDRGQRAKLLSSTMLSSHPRFTVFLQSGANKGMSWVHDAKHGRFYQAHKTLYDLALEEEKFLGRKKTLLSLSKLAALCAEDTPQTGLEEINMELDLILHQELLPKAVVQAEGLDPDNMSVLKVDQLIQLYVGNSNSGANEFDFKKALDLLQFIDRSDPFYRQLLILIWSKAILRDKWDTVNTSDPLRSCRQTVFMKTLELVHTHSEGGLKEFLPGVSELLQSEYLQDLVTNENFLFLVGAGMEYVARLMS